MNPRRNKSAMEQFRDTVVSCGIVPRHSCKQRNSSAKTNIYKSPRRTLSCRGDTRPARGSKLTLLSFARTVDGYHPSNTLGISPWRTRADRVHLILRRKFRQSAVARRCLARCHEAAAPRAARLLPPHRGGNFNDI